MIYGGGHGRVVGTPAVDPNLLQGVTTHGKKKEQETRWQWMRIGMTSGSQRTKGHGKTERWHLLITFTLGKK